MNLDILQPKLPHMQCTDGCGRCCGPVIANTIEVERIQKFIAFHEIVPQKQGITCPLYLDGTCAVYDVRPFICRMFGHTPKMVCMHGHNVNVPQKREAKLMNAYIASGRANFYLHGLVYSEDETLEIITKYMDEPEEGTVAP